MCPAPPAPLDPCGCGSMLSSGSSKLAVVPGGKFILSTSPCCSATRSYALAAVASSLNLPIVRRDCPGSAICACHLPAQRRQPAECAPQHVVSAIQSSSAHALCLGQIKSNNTAHSSFFSSSSSVSSPSSSATASASTGASASPSWLRGAASNPSASPSWLRGAASNPVKRARPLTSALRAASPRPLHSCCCAGAGVTVGVAFRQGHGESTFLESRGTPGMGSSMPGRGSSSPGMGSSMPGGGSSVGRSTNSGGKFILSFSPCCSATRSYACAAVTSSSKLPIWRAGFPEILIAALHLPAQRRRPGAERTPQHVVSAVQFSSDHASCIGQINSTKTGHHI
eukprot:9477891-Pyramimonas_sp.AAC.5